MNESTIGLTFNLKVPKQSSDEWNDSHEHILKDWKIKMFIDMWLQKESATYYSSIESLIYYPAIIISSLSSITIFVSESLWSKYFVGATNICVGFLTAITRHLKPSEMYQQHMNTANKYSMFIRTIDTCLELPKEMRPAPDVLIEKIGTELDNLNATQLVPPIFVINKFEKKYGPIHQILFGNDIAQLLYSEFTKEKK